MEYVYAVLLLHKLQKPINEDNVKKVIKASGVTPDEVKVKALVSALSEINIDEALKSAAFAPTIAAPTPAAAAVADAKKEEAKPKEKEEKKEEEALEGLSSLFG
jgi:large subunit ribosomal protein L12